MNKFIILISLVDNDFAEKCEVAFNRGSGQPKENIVFDSYDEAEEWCLNCTGSGEKYQIVEIK